MSDFNAVIFVLDDDQDVLDHITRAVESSGHSTDWLLRTRQEGYDIDELLLNESPDVCVVDWDYSRSDSADANEIVRRIRQASRMVPVLRFTQFTTPEDAELESQNERSLGDNLKTLSKSDATLHSPVPYGGLIRILERVLLDPKRQWT
jgi:DNA-binding NtrC family response regulator